MKLPQCLDVFIGTIDELQTDPSGFACADRRALIASPQHEDLRRSRIADWQLLRLGLAQVFALREEELAFRRDAYGRWSCDGPAFSLSHTEHYAACALSDLPVGVDCEEPDRFESRFGSERLRSRMLDHVCTPEERALPQEQRDPLPDLWVKKESLFKLQAAGSFCPGSIDTLHSPVTVFDACGAPPVRVAVAGERLPLLRVWHFHAGVIRRLR